MKKFKIGDRVVAKVPVGGKHAKDQHGTVIGFSDECNVWIGRCVALCKALHKLIPAFITEG